MRKRILLIAAPLVVVAIAASVAVAAPDAEHSRGSRLDKLHAERPIAASDSSADLSITDAGFQKAATDIQNFLHAVQADDKRALGAQVVGDYIASLIRSEAEAAAAAPRVRTAVYSSSHPGDFLSCIRQRESGGNYGIYNSGGSGAAGA